MDDILEQFRVKVSTLQNYMVKTAARESVARNLLLSADNQSATVILMAVRNLYGISALYWEPETIWLTLESAGVDLSEESRNKLLAAIAILRNPAFFWDNLAFQRTVQAFNDELFDPETLQECHPAHMAWAVYEATLLRGLDPDTQDVPEIDEDVQQYIAVCLKRAGYVCAPSQLRMVDDNLLKLLDSSQHDFVEEVKRSWVHLDKKSLPTRTYLETPLDVQLAQLASCYEYVKERAASLAASVLDIEHAPA